MNNLIVYLRAYRLDKYFKLLVETNTSNDLPYHNLYHILHTTEQILIDLQDEEGIDIKYHDNLTFRQKRNLLIASLYHDFKHSGGKKSDKENVQIACDSIKEIMINLNEDKSDIEDVISIVKATEYPYTCEYEDLKTSQKIMRDNDLLQCTSDNFKFQMLRGLMSEMNNNSYKDALKNYIAFLENIQSCSSKVKMNIFYTIQDLKQLYEFLYENKFAD